MFGQTDSSLIKLYVKRRGRGWIDTLWRWDSSEIVSWFNKACWKELMPVRTSASDTRVDSIWIPWHILKLSYTHTHASTHTHKAIITKGMYACSSPFPQEKVAAQLLHSHFSLSAYDAPWVHTDFHLTPTMHTQMHVWLRPIPPAFLALSSTYAQMASTVLQCFCAKNNRNKENGLNCRPVHARATLYGGCESPYSTETRSSNTRWKKRIFLRYLANCWTR